jgi:hypothetical protein
VTAGLALAVLLPAAALDGLPSVCLLRAAGISWCPGCGMSRALWHVVHGDISAALGYNWRVALVGPILAFLYLRLGARSLSLARRNARADQRPTPAAGAIPGSGQGRAGGAGQQA